MTDVMEELLTSMYDEDSKLTEKQRSILKSAIEIFSEKGFAAASTSEIAKKAGVAEGTIFRHYKTKKELLFAIVSPIMIKTVVPVMAKSFVKEVFKKEYDSYEKFVKTLFVNRRDFVRKNLPLLKIVIQEIAFQPEFKAEFAKVFKNNLYDSFVPIVEHFKEKGDLKDWPTDKIIRFTISTIGGAMITQVMVLSHMEWDDDVYADEMVEFLMSGVGRR